MINIKKTCANKGAKVNVNIPRTIKDRQFGLIAQHVVCYAYVDGQYYYRGFDAIAHIKHKLPNKLVQAWLY